jgi:ABC-type oligopeptide transport system substrate-binding subunit
MKGPSVPACETRAPALHPADTVTVVVFDKIDLAHAPWGQNREERFVFSHLYETLVTIDCHGQVQPGLAKSWKPGSDAWMVELRDDA